MTDEAHDKPAAPAEPQPTKAAAKARRRPVLFAGTRRLVRWSLRCALALAVYALVIVHTMPEVATGPWYIPSWRELAARFETVPAPPPTWMALAKNDDRLDVKGLDVAYWGRPDAPYGARVTKAAKAPIAIIVHFTDDTPALTLVQYGHRADFSRGNNAFGYHFYIDPAGRVFQGAPLSVRTNHIKPAHAPERGGRLAQLDGANTIGVSLIGACRSPPLGGYRCDSETVTHAQMASGKAIIAALQKRYGLACGAVYGHGELQTDRKLFEGQTLTAAVKRSC